MLGAASLADELAFVALADLAQVVATGAEVEYRLIGGIMVNLHAQRWKLGNRLYRLTGDADVGVPPAVARDSDVFVRLEKLGYTKVAGNRFERRLDSRAGVDPESAPEQVAAIDVLVPAYTSRARDNVRVGELQTTEVRGLAFALNRPPIRVNLEMVMLDNNTTLNGQVLLPDEASALVLRAYAWRVRGADKDVVDLWRALEIASAASVNLAELASDDASQASEVIRRAFLSPGNALDIFARVRGLSSEERTRMGTRLKALVAKVLGESADPE